jgi:hypothetical protein
MHAVFEAALDFFWLTLAAAALSKVDSWTYWSSSVSNWFPLSIAGFVRVAVPVSELMAAVLLIADPIKGLMFTGGLLAFLGFGVLLLMPSSKGSACGCFGTVLDSRIGFSLAIRNLLLSVAAFATAALVHGRYPLDLDMPHLLIAALIGMLLVVLSEARRVIIRSPTSGKEPVHE